MKLETVKKLIAILLLLVAGIFLAHTCWTDIVFIMGESLKMLSQTQIRYVILAFLTYVLSVYLFAVRWQKVIFSIGFHLKATGLFPILFGAIFVNNLTPANRTGGEPLRILWAKKSFGITYTDGFISILFERVVEAVPIFILLIFVLYEFPSLKTNLLTYKNILSINSAYILILGLFLTGVITWFFREIFAPVFENIQQSWKQLDTSFLPALGLSCAVWVLEIVRLKYIALALNLYLSLYIIVSVLILHLLPGLLPLTPSGLGIVEGGLIFLLLYFGLPLTFAGSFVFLERFISYGLSSLIGFLYLFYYGGFTIWKSTKSQ